MSEPPESLPELFPLLSPQLPESLPELFPLLSFQNYYCNIDNSNYNNYFVLDSFLLIDYWKYFFYIFVIARKNTNSYNNGNQ